ncbi:MAG TPA: methylated-DNA--[protein]-cysteine S-methyltransferase [Alphaproteobacteria bacterium]|nr:methylated-DNA--[protein]-cysteine S-methyltransferase [Alphaproteobacteria bacterium]
MPHISLNSAFGSLTVFEEAGVLVAVEWGRAEEKQGIGETPLLIEARNQMRAYFAGELEMFDLPLAAKGTDFQVAAWRAMSQIPYGVTKTYSDIARGLASGPRAVGTACARNPLPIIVPCHRVVGLRGRLGGYTGSGGIATKKALLRLEGALTSGGGGLKS